MTWAQICELAECDPEFDTTFKMNKFIAVNWLCARLIDRDHHIRLREIEEAYDGRHDA